MEKKEKLLLFVLVAIGFFLRIWRLRELMGFDYDQEVAAFAVDNILSGKLTLIGQEISIGGVFIGPAYYYLLSLFYWIFAGDPLGVGYMVAFFSIGTMLLLFFLAKELFNKRTAFLSLAFYVTSSQINFYDRTTAPSNLIIFMVLLSIILLLKIRKGKTRVFPLLVLSTFGTMIHLHPSTLVIIPIIIFFWILWKIPRPSPSQIVTGFIAALLVISPMILFNFRHDYLISKGIIIALNTPGEQAYFFLFKFLTLLNIQFDNLVSLFAIDKFGTVLATLLLMIFWKFTPKKKRDILTIWILIPLIVFSFYSRHIPEYYLLTSTPALIYLIAVVINSLLKKYHVSIVYLFLSLIIFLNLKEIWAFQNPYGFFHKQQAIDFIKKQSGEEASVSFDTNLGLEAGFRYLLKKNNVKIADNNNPPTHTIVMPPKRREFRENEAIFGGIKVLQSQSISERTN